MPGFDDYSSDDQDDDLNAEWDYSGSKVISLNCATNLVSIDIDVDSLLREHQLEGDYSPFPNKLSAMLYCLLNSPKPIVLAK